MNRFDMGPARATVRRGLRAAVASVGFALAGSAALADVCPPNTCCNANPGGATCGGDSVATQGNDSGANQGAGNPINIVTGNKYQREVDMAALPGVLGLEIVRHYNSAESGFDSKPGILGRGWRLSYDAELAFDGDESLRAVQADGSTIVFHRLRLPIPKPAAAGEPKALDAWVSGNPLQGRVDAIATAHGTEYRWRWAGAGSSLSSGRELLFDGHGKLVQISAPTGEFVTLQRDRDGLLVRVTDPQGRSLQLNYLDREVAKTDRGNNQRFRGVQSIDSPVGRFTYSYNDFGKRTPEPVRRELAQRRIDPILLLAHLVQVDLPARVEVDGKAASAAERAPGSSSRLYHYESPAFPTLLTGISVSGRGDDGVQLLKRVSTYGYDARGRANLSVKGEPAKMQADASGKILAPARPVADTGIEQVTLEWPKAGLAVLTNALGQQTRYATVTIAGQSRIVEAIGPGCSTCGPSNMRWSYDTAGRVVDAIRLGRDGVALAGKRTEYDALGRAARVLKLSFARGKPAGSTWLVRYDYESAEAARLSVVARPSIVAGKERQFRYVFNAQGQPITMSESGFSPVDSNGNATPQGTPIARTTQYRYVQRNGRSVLAEIAGPMSGASVPADSFATRLEWDAGGNRIVAEEGPLGVRTRFSVDAAGRIDAIDAAGRTKRFGYDAASRLTAVSNSVAGGATDDVRIRYDALGRAVERLAFSEGKETPESIQGFDIANRLTSQADRLGVVRRASYDPEGHLLATRVDGAGTAQEESYAYDVWGKLTVIADGTGATRRLVRDVSGTVVAVADPLGRLTRFEPTEDDAGPGLVVTKSVNTGKPLTMRYRAGATGQVKSLTAVSSTGSRVVGGTEQTTERLVDDFGREVAVFSPAAGKVWRAYDAHDRVTGAHDEFGNETTLAYDAAGRIVDRTFKGSAGAQERIHFTYRGALLTDIAGPSQSEHYDYDDSSRVIARVIVATPTGLQPVRHVTRYGYGTSGELQSETLPDGSALDYVRNGQRQVIEIHRREAGFMPFGWGSELLASDMQRDLAGLTSIRYGNGVVGRFERSRQGVLARVWYQLPESAAQGPLRSALEALVPTAHAVEQGDIRTGASAVPGALALPIDPRALWDSRLLFDATGNVLLQGQYADSAITHRQLQTYLYDGLDQLGQAVLQRDQPALSLAGETAAEPAAWQYFDDSIGNRLFAKQPDASDLPSTANTADRSNRFDGSRQRLRDGARSFRWDGQGRLTGLTAASGEASYGYDLRGQRVSKHTASGDTVYLYNARRQRIAELDGSGAISREYVWMGDRLLVVLDLPKGVRVSDGSMDLWNRLCEAVAASWRRLVGSAPSLYFAQLDHRGAPIALTDRTAKPVWWADYAPYGDRLAPGSQSALQTVSASSGEPTEAHGMVRLDLRLPGQWADAESGLYLNDFRYYDPRAGKYLSPDPIGLRGDLNTYRYAANNPLTFVDPSGLVLFAFDGTGNTNDTEYLQDHNSSLSNVYLFRGLYDSGDRRYITGVGTVDNSDPDHPIDPANFKPWYVPLSAGLADSGGNYSGPARVDRMIDYFNKEAELATDDDTAMDVDIIGFSRGAAEARDFANQIIARTHDGLYRYRTVAQDGSTATHCQRVDFRFMGLWDTVLSTNYSGHGYDLSISSQFAYVAQAVALNEYRADLTHAHLSSFGAFPLESIMDQGTSSPVPVAGKTRVERGFIGAHADIGGGFADGENQLPQLTLAWMVQQAQAAGVQMNDSSTLHSITADPVVHDKSDSIFTGLPAAKSEDRIVRYRDGSTTTQRSMILSQGLSYPDTASYIKYLPVGDPRRRSFVTGTVDVKKYVDFLNDPANGYGLDFTVQ